MSEPETRKQADFRILEVVKKGNTGKKVIVRYYDTKEYKLYEKEEEHEFVTPTREIIPEKYGITIDQIVNDLKLNFDGKFVVKPYGSKWKFMRNFKDRTIYKEGVESFIIWHYGNAEDKNNLEYFLDEEKKKQIFIRNSPKRFKARTRMLDQIKLKSGKAYLDNILAQEGISPEDIKIKERGKYIEVLCTNKELKKLDTTFFRILAYKSKEFKTEEEAEKERQKIKDTPNAKKHIDQAKIIRTTNDDGKEKFYVKLTSDNNKSFTTLLRKNNFQRMLQEGKPVLSTREELWDPLFLNTTKKQLRDFNPAHIPYNPNLSLKIQMNTKPNPFYYLKKSKRVSELEEAICDATNFFKKNTAIEDFEVIDFDKEVKISGRMFLNVLNSQRENKIYITKEAWRYDSWKKKIVELYPQVKFEFPEDEIEEIAIRNHDTEQYEFVEGHNFEDFDQRHTSKFNYEDKLFKKGKITLEQKQRIKEFRKKYKTSRLWTLTKDKIFDTYKYLRPRVDILEDNKLATYAGFKKSISYEEMHELIKSGKFEDLEKVIDYTITDGIETRKLSEQIIENAVIESFAANMPLHSIFSSDPAKKFYDAGQRRYFMKLNTYRDRHEVSPVRHLEKFKSRLSPHEILRQKLKGIKQKEGIYDGVLYYPSIHIKAFKDLITANPVGDYVVDRLKNQRDPVLKADILSKLSALIQVPEDKVKNYIEAAGLEFEKHHSPEEIYKSLSAKTEDEGKQLLEETEDFEMSRTSYIFALEYGVEMKKKKTSFFNFDTTMLYYNNLYAKELEKLKNAGFDAKSKKYFVSNKEVGYKLGNIRVFNMRNNAFIGKIEGYEPLIFQQTKGKFDESLVEMITHAITDSKYNPEAELEKIYEHDQNFLYKHQNVIRALTGRDPKKSKATLPLLFK